MIHTNWIAENRMNAQESKLYIKRIDQKKEKKETDQKLSINILYILQYRIIFFLNSKFKWKSWNWNKITSHNLKWQQTVYAYLKLLITDKKHGNVIDAFPQITMS